MNDGNLLQRHTLLLQELKLRMTKSGRWLGVPGLLDELHALRCQHEALPPAETVAAPAGFTRPARPREGDAAGQP